jgi:Carboxypeptidase regulatory-like domain
MTRFPGCRFVPFLVLMSAFPARIPAQTTQGFISGRIVNSQSGRPVAGAEIRCTIAGGGSPLVARSGAGGYFVLPLLSPGTYRLRVEAARYQAAEVHQLDVPVAGRLDLQFRLRPQSDVWQAGQYRSVFLPNTDAILTFYGPDVDTSRSASFAAPRANRGALEASISQVVDPVQVRDLPLAGRDVYTTLILQPGVAAGTANSRGLGLAVSGQRPTASNFLLDGAENNNYLVSGPLSSVAPEAVQEYRISTNNFSAEYGRTAGVLANAVTRAGGNQWHGLGYSYAKNSVWNANDLQRNLAGITRPALHEIQPGFQAGGPLLRNRLFASASVEYLRSRGYGDPVTVQLPSSGFYSYLASLSPMFTPGVVYARKLLADHPGPVPQSPALAATVDLALPNFVDRWLALERLDYAGPGGKHRVAARVSQARVERPDFIWSPYQGFNAPLTDSTYGLAGSLTRSLSPTLTNEARASWSSDELQWERPHPEIPTLAASDQTLLPGSLAFYAYRNRSRTGEFSDGVVWARGRHLMQFGGGLLLRGIDGTLTAGRDGRFTFDTVLQFATASPTGFSAVLDRAAPPAAFRLPGYDRNYRYTQFQLYAQDTLRATRRLVFNYGVRYENFGSPANTGPVKDALFQPGAGPALSARLAAGTLAAPASGSQQIYGRDNRGWAARLGGSYDLAGKGNLLLRGAFGIFYDRPYDNLWANTRLNNSVLANFDIAADSTNFLAPAQLSTYRLQRGNSGFPDLTWVDAGLRNAYVESFFLGVCRREISLKCAKRRRKRAPGLLCNIKFYRQ